VANPGGEKLAREASWIHAGKFAKQIELAFSYDVDWIGDGEVITDVFVLDLLWGGFDPRCPESLCGPPDCSGA
jgi:hypothetical protein